MIYKCIVNVILFYGMILKIMSFMLNEFSTYMLSRIDTTFESKMKDFVNSKSDSKRRRHSTIEEEDELDTAFSETGSVAQSVRSDMRFAHRK